MCTRRRKWWNLRTRYWSLSWHYHRRPIFPGSCARGGGSRGKRGVRSTRRDRDSFQWYWILIARSNRVRSSRKDISCFLFANERYRAKVRMFYSRPVCLFLSLSLSMRHYLLFIIFIIDYDFTYRKLIFYIFFDNNQLILATIYLTLKCILH